MGPANQVGMDGTIIHFSTELRPPIAGVVEKYDQLVKIGWRIGIFEPLNKNGIVLCEIVQELTPS